MVRTTKARARDWLRRTLLGLAALMALAALSMPSRGDASASTSSDSSLARANDCPSGWARWARFKQDFMSDDGRVIDVGSSDERTVSEGQSYALFFALVADDRPVFDKVLQWTENNLAQGDLTKHLPAWLWGHGPDGRWGVLDANSASDADLWIAYALLEAGAHWQERSYTARGVRVAQQAFDAETAALPGLGPTLLPGPFGFHPSEDEWRVNPSYVPLQVLRGLAARLSDDPRPGRLLDTSKRMLLESAPKGFAPDWAAYRAGQFGTDSQTRGVGSYDAIRVYLWAGMLDAHDPDAAALLTHFAPFADLIAARGAPPETVDTATGEPGANAGNAGFSAAVLPFLIARGAVALADTQAGRIDALERQTPSGYFSNVLALFGLGWRDGRYRFAPDGTLVPRWSRACAVAR